MHTLTSTNDKKGRKETCSQLTPRMLSHSFATRNQAANASLQALCHNHPTV
jgi:hypothetical protein